MGSTSRRLLTALACALGMLVALSPAAARAEEAPYPGWFLPVGLNLGGSVAPGDGSGGFIVGGEVSAVHLFGSPWVGVYGDGLYDAGVGVGRISAGLEAGWLVFGAELGYAAEIAGARADHGLRAALLCTGGVLGGYVRWLHLARDETADRLEIGLLLKWPLAL